LLESGAVPWCRPWKSGTAVNWLTQKPYRGINALLLDTGEDAIRNGSEEGLLEKRKSYLGLSFLDKQVTYN
jgi:antirestriction protein ArdC